MNHYLTSEEIVELAAAPGVDDNAWVERVCRPICEGIIQRLAVPDRDTREDMIAVGMRETWRARDKVRANANAFAYLTQTAKREMIHELRRQGRLDRARVALIEELSKP